MTVSAATKTEFLTNKTKYTPCRTSIQHWQLRDLVCACPVNPDELYYVHQNTIQHFSTTTKKQSQIQQLDFSPVSFTVAHGFMAVGGQESQLLVKDLKNNRICYNGSVGGSINNACHIASFPESSTDPHRLLVSNNDNCIKVFSLPSMEHVTYINLNVAVNYCSTSSDGNTLASVGDNNYVLLFDVRSSYNQVAKLKEYSDGGFACSFNAENTQLCAASQDGTLVVWDLRSRKVLTKVKAKQKAHRGAIRSVKYSKTSCVDLLVYSEHTSYIHALDTRNFKEYQSVRISLNDKNISGLCFSANSKNVYVGTEDCILSYDVDMISRRMFAQGDLL